MIIRYGLFPTNKQIISKEISYNWIDFLKKINITKNRFSRNNLGKDNEIAFIYLGRGRGLGAGDSLRDDTLSIIE